MPNTSPTRNNLSPIPWIMAATRAALGPVLILGEASRWSPLTLVALILTALFSDIFDGILARRWHCATPALRLFDTVADTFFYVCTAVALFTSSPQLWHTEWSLFTALMSFEAARLAFDQGKFGKPASYHSYLAKTWGLLLAIAVIAHFALQHSTHHGDSLITAALIFGIVCNLEGLAMSLILPAWQHDVKTVRAAWLLRQQILTMPQYPRTSIDFHTIPIEDRTCA